MNTDKLVVVLNHINCEGYDNSEWGVYGGMEHTSYNELFPVDSSEECPNNFIWLWLSIEEQWQFFEARLKQNELLEPDLKLTPVGTHSVILIWDLD